MWARAAYLGITFIAPAVFSFAVAVTRDWLRRRRQVVVSWLISALLCVGAVGTDALMPVANPPAETAQIRGRMHAIHHQEVVAASAGFDERHGR